MILELIYPDGRRICITDRDILRFSLNDVEVRYGAHGFSHQSDGFLKQHPEINHRDIKEYETGKYTQCSYPLPIYTFPVLTLTLSTISGEIGSTPIIRNRTGFPAHTEFLGSLTNGNFGHEQLKIAGKWAENIYNRLKSGRNLSIVISVDFKKEPA